MTKLTGAPGQWPDAIHQGNMGLSRTNVFIGGSAGEWIAPGGKT